MDCELKMVKLVKTLGLVFTPFFLFFAAGCTGIIMNPRDVHNDPQPGQNLIYEVKADKLSVYPNEPIFLTYELLTRYDTRYEGFKVESQLPGFWIENIPYAEDIERRVVKRNEFRMVWAVIRKQILYPIKPGIATIRPGTVKIGYLKRGNFSSFFSSPVGNKNYSYLLMESPPIKIEVKEYPAAGKPKDFAGAYGDYKITARYGSTTEAGLIEINLTITGAGNFYALEPPSLHLDSDLKIIDVTDAIGAETSWKDPVLRGSKTFEWTLLPSRTGDFTLPPIVFSYFSGTTKAYQVLSTEGISFHVDKVPTETPVIKKHNSGLVILFDVSGSMQGLDYSPKSRFDIEKHIGNGVVERGHFDFLEGKFFAAEVTDLFGTKTEPEKRGNLIQNMKIAEREKDGTALGDALYGAIASLNKFVNKDGEKRILLFTDGQNNKGHLDPETAVDNAREAGIIIHTIAIGNKDLVLFPVKKGDKTMLEMTEVGRASENIRGMADKTGGKHFIVENENDLGQIVAELLPVL